MPTRTISISEAAYELLKALKRDKENFSDVIIRFFPARKKLSHILIELGADPELAEVIESTSETLRHEKRREIER